MSSLPPVEDAVHKTIHISNTPDMILEVKEDEHVEQDDNEDPDQTTPAAVARVTFHVERGKLEQGSPYFRTLLRKPWVEASRKTVTLEGDNAGAVEIWLRCFHSALELLALASVSIETVWYVVLVSDKYDIDRALLKTWFTTWFDSQCPKDMKKLYGRFAPQMLFPCFAFDYALGFKKITHALAYHWPHHIYEVNPTDESKMYIPPRILQQLNAVKGRLRNILHRGLFDKICEIVDKGKCDCKEQTVFRFLAELRRVHVWPLEDTMAKSSIETMLERLNSFDGNRVKVDNGPCGCLFCTQNWARVVNQAIERVRTYFDGLCMDCMRQSKDFKFQRYHDSDSYDSDMPPRYDRGCRFRHGEPTWYFSYMGRREKRGLIADA